MKWDPNEYGGITDIRFASSSNDLWRPDVLLFNSADDKFDANFPYGSWTYTGRLLDLHIDDPGVNEKDQMDLKYYLPNGEWDLLAYACLNTLPLRAARMIQ
uniref:Neurotransmitter-gated ion-channel ligand-binding domain-containing protein n=1 Tax=Parascaris equorum TaxID=6256 RepID=A0A914R5Y1_PAREQ